MADDLPSYVSYTNDLVDKARAELNGRIDKLGAEVAEERSARDLADKELADDITKLTTSRLSRSSRAARWALGVLVTAVVGGVITVAIAYFEALSHLTGGIP